MKFEREIPIGLDARRKKWQGGAIKAPPPMGLGLRGVVSAVVMGGGGHSSHIVAGMCSGKVKQGGSGTSMKIGLSGTDFVWNTKIYM